MVGIDESECGWIGAVLVCESGRVALLWNDVLGTRIDRIYWLVGCVFIRLGWFAWACVAREMRGDEG